MPLIKCPECGQEISDKAFTCPHCGNPIKDVKSVSIEKTKKKWKKIRLLAILILIIGVFLLIKGLLETSSSGKTTNATEIFGFVVILIAGILTVIASIGAWWDNK